MEMGEVIPTPRRCVLFRSRLTLEMVENHQHKSPSISVDSLYSAAAATAAKLFQSCPTLCDPIDGSPPGSPIPGILQARTLEWVAISFSKA